MSVLGKVVDNLQNLLFHIVKTIVSQPKTYAFDMQNNRFYKLLNNSKLQQAFIVLSKLVKTVKIVRVIMEIGITLLTETKVTSDKTAKAMGSGTLNVFATPAMIALIEETAWKSVAPYLDAGMSTVGIQLNISHLAPTPLGMTVKCETKLTAIDGRKLTFDVKVFDECGLIGQGSHERFIVKSDKFQAKADSKNNK